MSTSSAGGMSSSMSMGKSSEWLIPLWCAYAGRKGGGHKISSVSLLRQGKPVRACV